jgi:hypothetical protein
LNEIGFNAKEVHTLYGGEEEENPKDVAAETEVNGGAAS